MKFRSQVYTAVSGSIGGLTYSHNRGGMYTRGRATPTNPNSAQQQRVRNALGSLAAAWSQTLTETQRNAWKTYAMNTPVTDAFGEPLELTGQQMYIRCNTPRLNAQMAQVNDGPTTFGQTGLTTPTVTWAAGEISIDYDNTDEWATAAGGYLLIQTSIPVSKTINYYRTPFRYLTAVAGNSTPPGPPEFISESAFGQLFDDYPGTRMFLRLVATAADGRLSPVQTIAQDIP